MQEKQWEEVSTRLMKMLNILSDKFKKIFFSRTFFRHKATKWKYAVFFNENLWIQKNLLGKIRTIYLILNLRLYMQCFELYFNWTILMGNQKNYDRVCYIRKRKLWWYCKRVDFAWVTAIGNWFIDTPKFSFCKISNIIKM